MYINLVMLYYCIIIIYFRINYLKESEQDKTIWMDNNSKWGNINSKIVEKMKALLKICNPINSPDKCYV